MNKDTSIQMIHECWIGFYPFFVCLFLFCFTLENRWEYPQWVPVKLNTHKLFKPWSRKHPSEGHMKMMRVIWWPFVSCFTFTSGFMIRINRLQHFYRFFEDDSYVHWGCIHFNQNRSQNTNIVKYCWQIKKKKKDDFYYHFWYFLTIFLITCYKSPLYKSSKITNSYVLCVWTTNNQKNNKIKLGIGLKSNDCVSLLMHGLCSHWVTFI